MSYQQNLKNWHLLADKFIWYNLDALKEIPEEITDDEIQTYLFTYHGMPSRMLCTDHPQANEQRIVPLDLSAKQAQQELPLSVGA